ncbi:hypothetical protein VTK56DRAFT_1125 [Thermocarpiscus australiensis]
MSGYSPTATGCVQSKLDCVCREHLWHLFTLRIVMPTRDGNTEKIAQRLDFASCCYPFGTLAKGQGSLPTVPLEAASNTKPHRNLTMEGKHR